MRVRQSLHTGSSLSALLAGQSVLHSNFMTLMEKIREYAESNRPFRLHLSDTRILVVKGRDWISTHPSRAVTSVSIGDNFRSREFHGEESRPNLTKLPVPHLRGRPAAFSCDFGARYPLPLFRAGRILMKLCNQRNQTLGQFTSTVQLHDIGSLSG